MLTKEYTNGLVSGGNEQNLHKSAVKTKSTTCSDTEKTTIV